MAAMKVFNTATLAIQIENGVSNSGQIQYRKKSFPNIKQNCPVDDLLAVANGIASILDASTGDPLLTEISSINTQA